jgi:hypothetical protein
MIKSDLTDKSDPAVRRAGWRRFVCGDCDQQWEETSRDIFSPSGVGCECCSNWVRPTDFYPDSNLETDEFGNLKNHAVRILVCGVEPVA